VLQTEKTNNATKSDRRAVVQARDVEAGNVIMKCAQDLFNYRELVMMDLSISVAANLGPGTIAIVANSFGDDIADEEIK